jgi:hypothetical protein
VAVFQIDVEIVDDLGNDGELFGGTDGSADTGGVGSGGLLPAFDVFKSFSGVEFLDGIKDIDFEAGTFKFFEIVDGDFGSCIKDGSVKCGVIPPFGSDFGQCAHFLPPKNDFYVFSHKETICQQYIITPDKIFSTKFCKKTVFLPKIRKKTVFCSAENDSALFFFCGGNREFLQNKTAGYDFFKQVIERVEIVVAGFKPESGILTDKREKFFDRLDFLH